LATAGADDGFAGVSFTPASSTPAAPVVTTPNSPIPTFTVGNAAVAVDTSTTVTSSDTDITGATDTITNYQSGDTLGIPASDLTSGKVTGTNITVTPSAGALTLSGSDTAANYQTALRDVTFSTTSLNTTARTIDVVADDSAASPTTSNTGVDTVHINIAAPVVTANQASINSTAGQTITVDSAVTVSSYDTDVTGATVTIGTGYQSGHDTLGFPVGYTLPGGIGSSYASGTLTLSGSATPAQYQTALQNVTYSSTSTSTTTRNISIVVDDSGDTGNVNSSPATTQILVSAPVTVTGAWIENPTWGSAGTENFFGYLASHSLGSATLGYALQTGANQLNVLPFANINTISVSFSGAVSDIGAGSLKLVGGTGSGSIVAPSVTGFTSDGSNTYSWTLSGSLGNNKYVFAIATTNSSFGTAGSTQVVDANGAGISGYFVTSSSTFTTDGNGLANSTFDFFFDLLPGDGAQGTNDNTTDTATARAKNTFHETSASYSAYYDYYGAGIINTNDSSLDLARNGTHNNTLTAPSPPSASQQVGSTGFTGLALGVQETGSSQAGTATPSVVSNASSPSTTSTSTTPASTGSTSSTGSGTTSSTTTPQKGRHEFAATDAAVSDFELADLYV
jgi:hypothetical protein